MGKLFSKKRFEDFTLLFQINIVLIIVKYKWNTWYFLSFNPFAPCVNTDLPSNNNISKTVRITIKKTFLKEYPIRFRMICWLIEFALVDLLKSQKSSFSILLLLKELI